MAPGAAGARRRGPAGAGPGARAPGGSCRRHSGAGAGRCQRLDGHRRHTAGSARGPGPCQRAGHGRRTGAAHRLSGGGQEVPRAAPERGAAHGGSFARGSGPLRALMSRLGPLGERNAYAQRLAQLRQVYAQLPLAYEVERPEGRDPLAEYLDGIRALHTLCQKKGASLAVVGEPTLHRGLMDGGADRMVHRWFILHPAKGDAGVVRLDSGWIELELSRYFSAAEKLCGSLGVPFTDPTRKLPANPLVFVDDVMLTNSGATTLAKSV
ncbi:MAG: hypothetical protein E6Q29_11895, partial [Alicycliphilus sp.]